MREVLQDVVSETRKTESLEKKKYRDIIYFAIETGHVQVQSGCTTLLVFRDQAHFDEWCACTAENSADVCIARIKTEMLLPSGFLIPADKNIEEIGYVGVAFSREENYSDTILKASIMFVPQQ